MDRTGNKRAIGTCYEAKAAAYLETLGYRILQKNYRCRSGEIDLIAMHHGYLVFVEVKYRRDEKTGSGMDAVDARKQRRIIRAASWYLTEHHKDADTPCRFDVVSFADDTISVIQDAFWC